MNIPGISSADALIMAYVPEFPNQLDRESAEKLAVERDTAAAEALKQDALKLSNVARAANKAHEAELLKRLGY